MAEALRKAAEYIGRLLRRPGRSLSFQLSFPVGVVIFLAVGLAAYFNIQQHRQQLTQAMVANGAAFADTLSRVTFLSMMGGKRGHLYQAIADVRNQPGVERVRIMNAEGQVIFSTDQAEVGAMVDKKAEACFACHAQDAPPDPPAPRGPPPHLHRAGRPAGAGHHIAHLQSARLLQRSLPRPSARPEGAGGVGRGPEPGRSGRPPGA